MGHFQHQQEADTHLKDGTQHQAVEQRKQHHQH